MFDPAGDNLNLTGAATCLNVRTVASGLMVEHGKLAVNRSIRRDSKRDLWFAGDRSCDDSGQHC